MCSIEEAWAGQTFDIKPTESQGDIHNSYMSLPDNVFTRNNEFSITNSKQPQPRNLIKSINSKSLREPKIGNIT